MERIQPQPDCEDPVRANVDLVVRGVSPSSSEPLPRVVYHGSPDSLSKETRNIIVLGVNLFIALNDEAETAALFYYSLVHFQ